MFSSVRVKAYNKTCVSASYFLPQWRSLITRYPSHQLLRYDTSKSAVAWPIKRPRTTMFTLPPVKLSRLKLSLLYSHTDPSNTFINIRFILKFVNLAATKKQTTDVTIPGAYSIDRIHSQRNAFRYFDNPKRRKNSDVPSTQNMEYGDK